MVQLEQDASSVEPMGKFTPVPVDDYLAIITASEQKDTKSGNGGKYLNLTFEIVEGEYKGRKIFDTLNLVNPSEKTVDIARQRLSSIQRCVGVIHLRDSNELHNIPLVISVGIKAADGQYDAKNVIKGFSRTDGKELKDVVADVPTTKVASSGAPATAAGKNLKPWQKQR